MELTAKFDKFSFVEYRNNIHLFIDSTNGIATVACIHPLYDLLCFTVAEFDVEESKLEEYSGEPITGGILDRLRTYRMSHDNIFGFAEEEMGLIKF